MPDEQKLDDLLHDIEALYRADEEACLDRLLPQARLTSAERSKVTARATNWINAIRRGDSPFGDAASLLSHFGLSSDEGDALICLTEALLRVPDKATVDALIRDKLSDTHWDKMLAGDLPSSLHMTGRALSLTSKLVGFQESDSRNPGALLGKLAAQFGQPVMREAIKTLIGKISNQFVAGETIETALQNATPAALLGVPVSFARLDEEARTEAEAEQNFQLCLQAVTKISTWQEQHHLPAHHGLSIKLSALHPRFESAQVARVKAELLPRLIILCEKAAAANLRLMIDAEEANRLFLTLDLAADLLESLKAPEWHGLGFTIQSYEKRAPAVIDAFAFLAQKHHRRLMLRLVKGTYWDTEIKRAQEQGWDDFPVFTRKASTDISTIACARQMLAHPDEIQPIFATHNALMVATMLEIASAPLRLSFERLQGMGTELYDLMQKDGLTSGLYAPFGEPSALPRYLARRLMENGANSSFVNRLSDPEVSLEDLIADPVEEIHATVQKRHPLIRRAPDLFAPERKNAAGIDLHDPFVLARLAEEMTEFNHKDYSAVPLIKGDKFGPADHVQSIKNPATGTNVGEVLTATPTHVQQAFHAAKEGYAPWTQTSVEDRALCLERLADLLEENRDELMSLLIHEAGKTIGDALAEVREAVDFCRYYALMARENLAPHVFPGPTGERNELRMEGRGIFICISPWRFPLAVFLGQVTAALVSGNSVIAKPAQQTPLIAAFASQLILESGVPEGVFHLLPGGASLGLQLVQHDDVAGVAFTGSTKTARSLNKALAHKDGPIVSLIAETSGRNLLIVDSTALPEQVVDDVMASTFRSAGQSSSALSLLCLPDTTADMILAMLKGALLELRVGDPFQIETDIGPIIDDEAQKRLLEHIVQLEQDGTCVARLELDKACANGIFVEPQIWEIPSVAWLKTEVFGPVLHVVRYKTDELDALIDDANSLGCGLTGGIHTRIDSVRHHVEQRLHAGNFYANKALIGSTVGVQPFGGEGYSGTGTKAGGPHYLMSFARERVFSTNLTAAGGDTDLIQLASQKD